MLDLVKLSSIDFAGSHEILILGPSKEMMGHAQVVAVEKTGALVEATDGRSGGQAAGW